MPQAFSIFFFFFLLLTSCSPLCAQSVLDSQDQLVEWRSLYREAKTEIEIQHMDSFMNEVTLYRPDDALALGFKAVAELMQSQYPKSPLDRWKQFSTWRSVLEQAIINTKGLVVIDDQRPLSIHPDLAFIRLGIQTNAPFILQYRDDIDADRLVVKKALSNGFWTSDAEHEEFVRLYFLHHNSE
jgi:hypothetical protein